MNPSLLFYKSVDKSVLYDGLSIPVVYQEELLQKIEMNIKPGQRKQISVLIEGEIYRATIDNIGFDRVKYPDHKDLLQIRYSKNSPIAGKLREEFHYTKELIETRKLQSCSTRLLDLKEEQKEFLAIYSSTHENTLVFECISNSEFREESSSLSCLGEIAAEGILDGSDPNASILLKTRVCKIRKLSKTITNDLKKLYGYRCQICGEFIGEKYGSNIIHAHHIEYFSTSLNNNSNNILICCPNHHGIIHDRNPIFDRNKKLYIYPNGYEEGLTLNFHI